MEQISSNFQRVKAFITRQTLRYCLGAYLIKSTVTDVDNQQRPVDSENLTNFSCSFIRNTVTRDVKLLQNCVRLEPFCYTCNTS